MRISYKINYGSVNSRSLLNEDESLPELCGWIESVMQQNGYSYEVILVDDGSTDASWEVIQTIGKKNPHFKGIKFQRNYGKSAALNEGFKAANGDVIITMDADMQDSPDEIPELRSMILEEGYDMVSGWKKKRYDNTLTKNLPSKLFNAVARKSSGIRLHDFNCGLKAYRKKVVKSIEVYGEMHRYIPILAKWSGFRKIGEKVVEHRPRKYGVTKFGWQRFINGFLDLATIMFLGKFGKRPMQFLVYWEPCSFSWLCCQYFTGYFKVSFFRSFINQQTQLLYCTHHYDHWYAVIPYRIYCRTGGPQRFRKKCVPY